MDEQDKTKAQLISELQQLRKENSELKALTDQYRSDRTLQDTSIHEKKLSLAMEAGKMAWWEMDLATGNVIYNPQKVIMLGYDPEDFTNYKDFSQLLHPDDYERVMDAMKLHMEGITDKYEAEYRILSKSGEYIWFYDFGSIIKDEQHGGRLVCTGFVYDITQRKQAEEVLYKSEMMLQTVMDNFPGIIFWKDTQSRYMGCNQVFAVIAGVKTPADIIGKSDFELSFEDTDAERFYDEDLRVMKSGQPINHQFEMIHPIDGSSMWFDSSKIPILDSKKQVIGVIGVSTDISKLKTTELQLLRANKELVEQNNQQTVQAQALAEALEKAKESDRLKSEFLSNISHEIRTPINSILGFTELLKDPEITSWKQQEFLEIIEKSVGRMLNIINDIVDYSKIESGLMKIYLSDTDINKELESIYDFYSPEAEYKGIRISIDYNLPKEQATIRTDRDKFYAILSNLVKNAIKFTRSGSIEIGYEIMGNFMEFFVKDTGIGVTEEQKQIIFSRFRQGSESENKKYEGAGLGLAISKAYVKALGGRIWVVSGPESEQEIGSVFYFTLPLKAEVEGEKATRHLEEVH